MKGPPLVRLFVNDLADVIKVLTLLFADDVKIVTWWTKNHEPSQFSEGIRGDLITTFSTFMGLLDIHPNFVFLPPTHRVLRGIPTTFTQASETRYIGI